MNRAVHERQSPTIASVGTESFICHASDAGTRRKDATPDALTGGDRMDSRSSWAAWSPYGSLARRSALGRMFRHSWQESK